MSFDEKSVKYYRVKDPLENFKIRVTIREVGDTLSTEILHQKLEIVISISNLFLL